MLCVPYCIQIAFSTKQVFNEFGERSPAMHIYEQKKKKEDNRGGRYATTCEKGYNGVEGGGSSRHRTNQIPMFWRFVALSLHMPAPGPL